MQDREINYDLMNIEAQREFDELQKRTTNVADGALVIAARLRAYCKAQKITQRELIECSGATSLGNVLSGKMCLSPEAREKVLRATNLDEKWLVNPEIKPAQCNQEGMHVTGVEAEKDGGMLVHYEGTVRLAPEQMMGAGG